MNSEIMNSRMQSFIVGIDREIIKNELVAQGIDERIIFNCDPVRPYNTTKNLQKKYMQDIADTLSVSSGDMIAIIIIRNSVKNGFQGEHAEIYRNFYSPYKEALQRRYIYPDMVFDKTSNVLMIAEHAFNLHDTLLISMDYFQAIVIQNEVIGESIVINSSAPKRKEIKIDSHALSPHDYPVSFTLEDVIDSVSTIQPSQMIDCIEMYTNNIEPNTPSFVAPQQLPFGRRHLVTQYPYIYLKAHYGERCSHYLFNPETGYCEQLNNLDGLTISYVEKLFTDVFKVSDKQLIIDSIGMKLPVHTIKDKYISFIKEMALHMISDIELEIIDADIRGSDLFLDRTYMGLYVIAQSSSNQPIKKQEETFRGKVKAKQKDKFSLIVDHQWSHDAHYSILTLILIDELAIGLARKLNYFGKGLLTTRDPSWLACAVLLKCIIMNHKLDAVEFRKKFFISENIENTAEALGVIAGDEFIELMKDLPKGFVEYASNEEFVIGNNSESILESAQEMLDTLWLPGIKKII
ncbi:MAG: hypothetical protein QM500_12470 [Methylococcales bacterium]